MINTLLCQTGSSLGYFYAVCSNSSRTIENKGQILWLRLKFDIVLPYLYSFMPWQEATIVLAFNSTTIDGRIAMALNGLTVCAEIVETVMPRRELKDLK